MTDRLCLALCVFFGNSATMLWGSPEPMKRHHGGFRLTSPAKVSADKYPQPPDTWMSEISDNSNSQALNWPKWQPVSHSHQALAKPQVHEQNKCFHCLKALSYGSLLPSRQLTYSLTLRLLIYKLGARNIYLEGLFHDSMIICKKHDVGYCHEHRRQTFRKSLLNIAICETLCPSKESGDLPLMPQIFTNSSVSRVFGVEQYSQWRKQTQEELWPLSIGRR